MIHNPKRWMSILVISGFNVCVKHLTKIVCIFVHLFACYVSFFFNRIFLHNADLLFL